MDKKKKLFFSGLNELRAIAALSVLIHHVEIYKHRLNIYSLFDFGLYSKSFISRLGKNGVFLFFVLSGFLITYLLIEEKNRIGKISVSKFYGRRVLRIWPLYFIILIAGFFVLPNLYHAFPEFFKGQNYYNSLIEEIEYNNNLLLYLLFMSNIALAFFSPVAAASHSWSVSVEEQFYLVWPWIIKVFFKKLLIVFLIIILGVSFFKFVLPNTFISELFNLLYIDFMAMGALFAYVYKNYNAHLAKLLNNKIVVMLILISVITHLVFRLPGITKALTFGCLIVLVIHYKFKVKPLDYIGRLSYGVYMYHPLMMYFSFSIMNTLDISNSIYYNVLVYSLVVGLTFLISYLSYNYLEFYFLKIKSRFSPIKSGNS